MPDHNIKKGLDIPIEGQASGEVVPLPLPSTIAIAPTELRGLTPRLPSAKGMRFGVATHCSTTKPIHGWWFALRCPGGSPRCAAVTAG